MAMTPLMSLLRRAIAAHTSVTPSHEAPVGGTGVSRRAFLATAATAVAVASCGKPAAVLAPSTRIAIVGGGLAGLNCAWHLHTKGIRADVYEASARTGGRILTGRDIIAPGSVTELGGEFIDSSHTDMIALAKEFQLELLDLRGAPSQRLHDVFYFESRVYTEADVTREIGPFIPRFAADIALLPRRLTDLSGSKGEALDRMSLDAYFHSCGITGWIRSFLQTAFVTENGLDLAEQSTLNFLSVIASQLQGNPFRWYGESDERFRLKDGNEQIVGHLAAAVQKSIHTGHVLESIRSYGSSYRLSFRVDGASKVIDADMVVLALPFSLLRSVDIGVELPDVKRQAINEARYGLNAKIVVGFERPFWHEQSHSGTIYSDAPVQLAWDNTSAQGITEGGLTFFSGGANSRLLWSNGITNSVNAMMNGIRPIWHEAPRDPVKINGFNWPDYPWSKGSYSTYAPGQWTKFYGTERKSVGNILFAGEHCSREGKGYMNGAAETGRLAAEEIIRAHSNARVR